MISTLATVCGAKPPGCQARNSDNSSVFQATSQGQLPEQHCTVMLHWCLCSISSKTESGFCMCSRWILARDTDFMKSQFDDSERLEYSTTCQRLATLQHTQGPATKVQRKRTLVNSQFIHRDSNICGCLDSGPEHLSRGVQHLGLTCRTLTTSLLQFSPITAGGSGHASHSSTGDNKISPGLLKFLTLVRFINLSNLSLEYRVNYSQMTHLLALWPAWASRSCLYSSFHIWMEQKNNFQCYWSTVQVISAFGWCV